jgi:hypothetical protein
MRRNIQCRTEYDEMAMEIIEGIIMKPLQVDGLQPT